MTTQTFLNSIYTDGSKHFVSNPNPKIGDNVKFCVQMLFDEKISAVFILAKINGVCHPKKMKNVAVKDGLVKYEISVQLFEKEFRYQFLIVYDGTAYYYDGRGISTYIPDETRIFRLLVNYEQPTWVKNAVFYQIFPERFCNGNSELDVKDGEYTFDGFPTQHIKDWNSAPEPYKKAHCLDFYGGDLQGIKQKIPYLKKLGVTALYLNPIFYAATVHKYDCLDYFHVDPHFGGDEALVELVEELHKNGMKIILDVSINHTGIANRWFNRDGTFFDKSEGAFNNPNSQERNYYFFNEDNSYKSWFGVATLPTLNYTSEALCNKIFRDENSLVKKWIKPPFNTDGWRFDVADTMARNNEIQLHHVVWPQIRKSIKEEKKDAYILAEDWTDCCEFLNGDEWDSPMNYYGSCRAIRRFFGENDIHLNHSPELKNLTYKMTARDLSNQILGYLTRLPFQIQQVQFNLLDSHDVPRMHNNPVVQKDFYKGAVVMMFTLPGAANIYYGDEAEIDGTIDSMEGCRYPMPWNKKIEQTENYKLYSTLSHLKTKNKVFLDGGFKVLFDEGYIFSYARFTREKLFLIIASNEDCDKTISLDMNIFGTKISTLLEPNEYFGEKLDAKYENGIFSITVKKGKSYLIEF